MGAEITSTISTEFPDIVGHIVENCITFRDEDMCDNDQEPGVILFSLELLLLNHQYVLTSLFKG